MRLPHRWRGELRWRVLSGGRDIAFEVCVATHTFLLYVSCERATTHMFAMCTDARAYKQVASDVSARTHVFGAKVARAYLCVRFTHLFITVLTWGVRVGTCAHGRVTHIYTCHAYLYVSRISIRVTHIYMETNCVKNTGAFSCIFGISYHQACTGRTLCVSHCGECVHVCMPQVALEIATCIRAFTYTLCVTMNARVSPITCRLRVCNDECACVINHVQATCV
jgi:hypothetical protein